MNVYFVLFFGISIVSNVCLLVNGTPPKRAMFTADGSYNGYVCTGNFTLGMVRIRSVIECASLCTDNNECDGFFYLQDNNTCVMCSDPFDDVVVMLGTIFYRRNGKSACGLFIGKRAIKTFLDPKTAGANCITLFHY